MYRHLSVLLLLHSVCQRGIESNRCLYLHTSQVATPDQAQDVHATIRAWLATKIGKASAALVRIIYGGSVKGASAPGLIDKPDIDGFLVGGASLLPDFVTIIKACHDSDY